MKAPKSENAKRLLADPKSAQMLREAVERAVRNEQRGKRPRGRSGRVIVELARIES